MNFSAEPRLRYYFPTSVYVNYIDSKRIHNSVLMYGAIVFSCKALGPVLMGDN